MTLSLHNPNKTGEIDTNFALCNTFCIFVAEKCERIEKREAR